MKFGRGLESSPKKTVSTFVGRKVGSPTFVEKEQLSSTLSIRVIYGVPGHSFPWLRPAFPAMFGSEVASAPYACGSAPYRGVGAYPMEELWPSLCG